MKTERASVSRELSDFLVELSIGVQKHAMYPGGHPSLGDAAAGVTRRAERLLDGRPMLVFGVARRQLIIDGVATDAGNPVLRRLAETLHRHHLGAVTLASGVQPDAMALALRALSSEVERDGPLGLATSGHRLEWPCIRLHPLTFDRLEIVGGATGDQKANARAAELWVGLARAAMTTERSDEAAEALSTEPSSVAKAIDEHEGAAAYDQVIVGYLLQIANELKTAQGSEAAALRRRTARLISTLHPETLRRLVEMGGDAAQRREFVLNAASGMAADAVIEIVKAAADASGQTISHGLMRMLTKLAEHAETASEETRPLAEGALRDQVDRLLSDWQLDDPNPDQYRKVLQNLATSAAATPGTVLAADPLEPLRIVQMSLEVGEVGPLVDRAMDRVIEDGRWSAVLRLLESPPAGGGAAASYLMETMAAPESMTRLVSREPLDGDALDKLFPRISLRGYEALLDGLVTSKNRSTRRRLLDRLGNTDLEVGHLIAGRILDERWYVLRNMLVLFQRLGRTPPGFSPDLWTTHADARVRFEAIQMQFTMPEERDLALAAALEDVDPKINRMGLAAIQRGCPVAMVPIVTAMTLDPGVAEELRVLAAGTLGRCADARAREALLQVVDGGRTLLGRPKLAASTPICVAALRALAEGWRKDRAAAAVLAMAKASPDPEIRQAADGRS